MKKHIALLSLLIAALLVASCGDAADNTTVQTNTGADTAVETVIETAELDPLEARKQVSDGVPELDFEGKDYRVFYQKRYTTDAIPETDEETGDVLNDAVFRRNKAIEERFNINIVGIEGEEDPMVKTLMSSVVAGEDAYELFMGHSIYSATAALSGYFYNWYDIPHMDFTKPWFPKVAIEGLTLNDRMYMTMSDMCLSFVSNAYCMFFNKQIAQSYDMEDIYQTVFDGKWTLDTLSALSKDMYKDINGDGTKDIGDQFGFTGVLGHSATMVFACDIPTVVFGADGSVTSHFNDERTVSMVEKLRELYKENAGSATAGIGLEKVSETDMLNAFSAGNALFITGVVGFSDKYFRDVTFDYGIIPYPKLDEAQPQYYSIPGGSVSGMAVPASTTDIELAGAVTQALCRESWVSVLPEYYDVVLKVKGARDETSVEMLDIIMDGRKVDTAFIYDSWKGYSYCIPDLLKGTKEVASYTASKEKSVIRHYESVAELFFAEE